ncbi:MAG: hypothetical protein MZV49_22680 [Rhodopseudomonas palustris]|nr:hypothetical protein [Rhodopseudomonas palustris]
MLQRCGLTVTHDPQATVATTPNDFHRMFPATGGALYGRASAWLDRLVPPPRCPHQNPGTLCRGRQYAPWTRSANGGVIRTLRRCKPL